MNKSGLSLVGWYHSHPHRPASPTIRDIDCQMTYQLKMKGIGSTYHPCLGFIIGQCLWVNVFVSQCHFSVILKLFLFMCVITSKDFYIFSNLGNILASVSTDILFFLFFFFNISKQYSWISILECENFTDIYLKICKFSSKIKKRLI